MVDYVFYSVVGLGISIILYRSLLKKEKLFKFNRFFLLASLSLCLLAPGSSN
jgi:N-acetylmuramoyl-L-alanine amidase